MDLKALLQRRKVIPAVKRITDLPVVFATSKAAVIILLGGSINELDEIKRASQKYPDKIFLMHIDLLNGVGKDAEGIRFLKQVGFHGIVSVKSQLLCYMWLKNLKCSRFKDYFCLTLSP
ncbi:MAG: glycerol-3-phosphate responsive antiterminator [Desulfitobacteriaceae bacterium]